MDEVKDVVEHFEMDDALLSELGACGQQAEAVVRNSLTVLRHGLRSNMAGLTDAVIHLTSLMKQSHEGMTGVHHSQVERRWRRLFTDAALLKAALALAPQTHEATLREAIRDLDRSIIVAGAPGSGRIELLHRTMVRVQSYLPGPAIRQYTFQKSGFVQPCPQVVTCRAFNGIKELPCMPDMLAYAASHHHHPFVVRGGALDWPSFAEGKTTSRWNDVAYLEYIAGPGRVVPVEIGSSYTDDGWRQSLMPWSDFLNEIGWAEEGGECGSDVRYLAQHNLFDQFPILEKDVCMPDLVYAGPPAPSYFPTYRPPIDDDEGGGSETVLLNAWLGPAGTVTPAHRDPYYNCYTQVVGHKLLWIAPFDCDEGTLPGAMALYDNVTSSLDVFAARRCDDDYDDAHRLSPSERAFAKQVEPRASFAVLAPGDVLVMPPMWFHALKSLTKSFSVSMWF